MDETVTMSSSQSILICRGPSESDCGYCKGEDTSLTFSMFSVENGLTVHDYQTLIDAGWRRSGVYLYVPDNKNTCCPQLTIRLPVHSFAPSKSHKRVLRRLRKYSCDDQQVLERHTNLPKSSEKARMSDVNHVHSGPVRPSSSRNSHNSQSKSTDKTVTTNSVLGNSQARERSYTSVQNILAAIVAGKVPNTQLSKEVVKAAIPKVKVMACQKPKSKNSKKLNIEQSTNVTDDKENDEKQYQSPTPHFWSNIALVLASTERQHAAKKLSNTVSHALASKPVSKQKTKKRQKANFEPRQMEIGRTLLPLFEELCKTDHPVVRNVELVPPGYINMWIPEERALNLSDADKKRLSDAFQSRRYISGSVDGTHIDYFSEMVPNATEPEDSAMSTSEKPVPFKSGPFTYEFIPSAFDEESFNVFLRYQMRVHKEPASKWSEERYRRFLVESPLVRTPGDDVSGIGYGSYHVKYRLNGVLFAVGVVDLLPDCLSSVYLFYDPDFSILSPGTLSALKEIDWVRTENARKPKLKYYYMGYFIRDCPKMRYKAAFVPSELLCLETRTWVPISQAVLSAAAVHPTRLASPGVESAVDISNYALTQVDARREALRAIVLFSVGTRIRFADVVYHFQRGSDSDRRAIDSIQDRIGTFIRLVGRRQSRSFAFYIGDYDSCTGRLSP